MPLRRETPEQFSGSQMCISLLGGTCNRDGEPVLQQAGTVTLLQYGRCDDIGRSEDESVEDSAAELSPDRQEAAPDDIARRLQMECVEERSEAIDPSPEAQEASNAITIQPDDDEDGNEDDDAQLDGDSTTCLEMIDRESRAETSDSECDTPVQLPSPPKRLEFPIVSATKQGKMGTRLHLSSISYIRTSIVAKMMKRARMIQIMILRKMRHRSHSASAAKYLRFPIAVLSPRLNTTDHRAHLGYDVAASVSPPAII
ncbi:uncharacterized protein DNG_05144 [Cephalotrichum gorgonifer]|uniref:Uncharacterized protein n=1 Tax=Cephalotrichum gorgonifer TaxID=2041049 RepID=A0AAE8MXE0_9PEZI|nr:uncharacterized protein DNG_05144 [Cephalotrichum gorgonifer]